jgi:RimJ/RimL family protein N-acetyltransferase
MVGHTPITKEEERRYYELHTNTGDDRNFEIHLVEDGRYIGNVGIKGIHPVHRDCELGIAIGDKREWGKGYGFDAIVTCLRYAFDTLGLHTVRIRAHEDHVRGLSLYRRVGFVETGRERETVFQDGRFADYICLDMIDREFRELYPAAR